MSGEAGPRATEEFATLLRELKDRSGLSYGTLAKRLHTSTSTLHRYCNGTAVPNDYAPVERLARVCRATPPELVELHRRWILADAARGAKAEERIAEVGEAGDVPEAADVPDHTATDEPEPAPASARAADTAEPVVVRLPPAPPASPGGPPRRRRTALIAAVAVAAVVGATVLVAQHPWSGDGGGDQQAVGATATTGPGPRTATPPPASASGTADPAPSTSAPGTPRTKPAAPPAGTPTHTGRSDTGTGTPITVGVRPYVYEDACSQHFLVDKEPAQMGPPASEQDAPRWAAAYAAVSSDEQRVALTVQGTGADTVVLEALHVRVTAKDAPLAWNDYSMGSGCGGGVDTKSFDIDLDRGSPVVAAKGGQRDFPYKVSESDPEVFYINAHTAAHDVRWDLSLDWSSGDRHGTVRIDNDGTAFRTSADVGRPGYDYPPGYTDWIPR
ncbi:Helix-turn-helix domain-containing protein [Actinacidiphila alni]|uniref:Helix-turn-helix domain-containing protein n=1 Tax=Actinacidiphila alni TaxID=380248 RepID=A0A1I2JFA3_9ACTN|nr:helix-turn-helix transcriptional regulator [Actinacidiphila alni]SFF52778.1 Helix-turn-helix domain-containing protein [Actinacidiphila alni]